MCLPQIVGQPTDPNKGTQRLPFIPPPPEPLPLSGARIPTTPGAPNLKIPVR